ncbi:Hypothetical_protein [Hexamita inflata]|uniref:Hypothetical_protein n=1 Tax=Hexamita inflata TaxID=28002 RepID=A0AA86Q313_9EUKA|nr:Hypothetical protein HINF_LOCUS38914 [Hexamita inflata]
MKANKQSKSLIVKKRLNKFVSEQQFVHDQLQQLIDTNRNSFRNASLCAIQPQNFLIQQQQQPEPSHSLRSMIQSSKSFVPCNFLTVKHVEPESVKQHESKRLLNTASNITESQLTFSQLSPQFNRSNERPSSAQGIKRQTSAKTVQTKRPSSAQRVGKLINEQELIVQMLTAETVPQLNASPLENYYFK